MFVCLFILFFFLLSAFLVFFLLNFFVIRVFFFSIRIFLSAFSHPHPPFAGIRSAFYRHPRSREENGEVTFWSARFCSRGFNKEFRQLRRLGPIRGLIIEILELSKVSLREDTKNGCVADYPKNSHSPSNKTFQPGTINWVACVAGVKRGRGKLGRARACGALIPFPFPFECLPRRL